MRLLWFYTKYFYIDITFRTLLQVSLCGKMIYIYIRQHANYINWTFGPIILIVFAGFVLSANVMATDNSRPLDNRSIFYTREELLKFRNLSQSKTRLAQEVFFYNTNSWHCPQTRMSGWKKDPPTNTSC